MVVRCGVPVYRWELFPKISLTKQQRKFHKENTAFVVKAILKIKKSVYEKAHKIHSSLKFDQKVEMTYDYLQIPQLNCGILHTAVKFLEQIAFLHEN